ncbi:unnamed protein product [Mytilus edulis]|uniref:Uncharacterized protein n=1 Tax=Mytilus edulis TaxID=6550 RepID=A0A8S3SDB9_MYTED|nr:unnamed protein product [Mytilus edulis]
MLHGMQRTTSEVLHYHTYDEIGSISNQAATVRFVVGEQEGQSQQTIVNQSSQITFNQNDNQMIFNNRPDTSLEETIDLPSQSSVEEIIYRSRSSIEEGYSSSDNSVRSFQRKHNQEERSSITNGTSSCSTDSEESKTDSLNRTSVDINVGDGYENPYQIISARNPRHSSI